MPKISFNPQALCMTRYDNSPYMGHAATCSAFKPVVVCRPGIEAIKEGFRLANIEGFELSTNQLPTGDIDT